MRVCPDDGYALVPLWDGGKAGTFRCPECREEYPPAASRRDHEEGVTMPTICNSTGCTAEAHYRLYEDGETTGPAVCVEHLGPLVKENGSGRLTILAMCHTLGACPEEGETSIGCCPEAWPGVNANNECECAAECQARIREAVPAADLAEAIKDARRARLALAAHPDAAKEEEP